MPALLKWELTRLPNWPRLKVVDWEPVARRFWKLDEKISSKDARYWQLNDFCKNARVRMKKKANFEQAQVIATEYDEEQKHDP